MRQYCKTPEGIQFDQTLTALMLSRCDCSPRKFRGSLEVFIFVPRTVPERIVIIFLDLSQNGECALDMMMRWLMLVDDAGCCTSSVMKCEMLFENLGSVFQMY